MFIEKGGIEIHHELLKESRNIDKLIECIIADEKLCRAVMKNVVENKKTISASR